VPTARAPFSSTSHLAPETVRPAESGLATSALFAPPPSPLSHTPAVPVRTSTTSSWIDAHALLVEGLLKPVRSDPEALGQRVLPLAGGHVDHGGRGDYWRDGIGAELQEPEVALDILREKAIVGVGRAPFVDVAERVDLGGDIVADEQRVANPRRVERVIFLARDEVNIFLGVQPVGRAEGDDLTLVVSLELVAAAVVGETEVVNLPFLDP
jgi:hypothetical protein